MKKDSDEIEMDIENKIIKSDKQIRILNFLKDNDNVTFSDLEVFLDATRSVVKTLEKNGYIEIIEKQIERNPFLNKNIKRTDKLALTQEQNKAFCEVSKSIEGNKYEEFLLYGVTGSRKDRSIFTID